MSEELKNEVARQAEELAALKKKYQALEDENSLLKHTLDKDVGNKTLAQENTKLRDLLLKERRNSSSERSVLFESLGKVAGTVIFPTLTVAKLAIDTYYNNVKRECEKHLTQHRATTQANIQRFTDPKLWKKVTITREPEQPLGIDVYKSGPYAVLPSVIISKVHPNSPASKAKLSLPENVSPEEKAAAEARIKNGPLIRAGDQVVSVNGQSIICMSFAETSSLISSHKKEKEVITLELVDFGGKETSNQTYTAVFSC